MPISKNSDVINSFLYGRDANGLNLFAQDGALYSYNLKLAEWTTSGIVGYDFTATGGDFRSMTTSQHVGLIKRQVKPTSIMLPEAARYAGLIA